MLNFLPEMVIHNMLIGKEKDRAEMTLPFYVIFQSSLFNRRYAP